MKKNFTVYITCSIIFISSLYASDDYFIPEKTLTDMEKKYGYRSRTRVESLIQLMNRVKDLSEVKKVSAVNNFFNNILYETDIINWKVKDYWATRMEFLGKAKGDCEDYAIAKYFTLKQLGIPENRLFMTYVKIQDNNIRQAHMVLSYFKKPNTTPYVLDNYNTKILPATKRKDLVPVYSFNGESLYRAKQTGLGKEEPSEANKNIKWSKLIDDIRRNKL